MSHFTFTVPVGFCSTFPQSKEPGNDPPPVSARSGACFSLEHEKTLTPKDLAFPSTELNVFCRLHNFHTHTCKLLRSKPPSWTESSIRVSPSPLQTTNQAENPQYHFANKNGNDLLSFNGDSRDPPKNGSPLW